jgi:UDP-N-acetylglucosamine acyltransferase
MSIDQSAIISPKAKLGNNVSIGAYSVIGDDVEIGDNTTIGSHSIISGPTKIGKNNKIFHFTSIGADPQDLKYRGEKTFLEIGDNNTFREFCSVHRGTITGHTKTVIGQNNLFMAYVHIAHDCVIGNSNVFANNTALAGHAEVGDFVVFGGYAVIAQFCLVGSYSFIAGTTGIAKDILPYTWVSDYHICPAVTYGINTIGLKRHGFSVETIRGLKKAYHIICKEGLKRKEIMEKLEEVVKTCPEVQAFIDMLNRSKHGVIK